MNSKVTRFLLADDDRDDREMFSEALAALAPEIVCEGVEDGRAALNLLSSQTVEHPSIIFIDINMPVMNGWDLLRNIKNDASFQNIPVVVYSTSSTIKDKEIAQDLGANCFVTKPDSFRLVKSMLEIVITHLYNNEVGAMCGQIHKKLQI